jgi:hypothetical protein
MISQIKTKGEEAKTGADCYVRTSSISNSKLQDVSILLDTIVFIMYLDILISTCIVKIMNLGKPRRLLI